MFMKDLNEMVNRLKMANVQAIQVSHKRDWAGRRMARPLISPANVADKGSPPNGTGGLQIVP